MCVMLKTEAGMGTGNQGHQDCPGSNCPDQEADTAGGGGAA
jgi:hypothetical protein